MCFTQPIAQTNPSNPAKYPLNENYLQVRSSVTRDGVKTGGQTIGEQKATAENPNTRPRVKADPKYRAGANLKL